MTLFLFQKGQKDLEPTGNIDNNTRERLIKTHDSDNNVTNMEDDVSGDT